MPELPEVETVRRGLHKYLIGLGVKSVEFDWPKGFPNPPGDVDSFLIGSKITDVKRHGKVLMIELNTNYTLMVHLKMTGQLVFDSKVDRYGAGHPNDSLVGNLPDKSTRVIIQFESGEILYFNDQRKFGWVKLMPTELVGEYPLIKKMGPEPLDDSGAKTEFKKRIARRKRSRVKAAILDQQTLAGVGNIYADESLFLARIHPERLVGQLSAGQVDELFDQIVVVLQRGLDSGGSTDRNYRDADGKMGSYLSFAQVFRREGQPCHVCREEIIKTRVAGRGTHICLVCQPKPRVVKSRRS